MGQLLAVDCIHQRPDLLGRHRHATDRAKFQHGQQKHGAQP
jgi:hypothetical protein